LDKERSYVKKLNARVHEQHQVQFSKRFEGLETFNSNADISETNTQTSVNKSLGYEKLRHYDFMEGA
jgi:hypothetical protein